MEPLANIAERNLDHLQELHDRATIVAAGSQNGTNEFIAIVTPAGLQSLVTNGNITQAQHDSIARHLTFSERLEANRRRFVVVFQGADAGHLTATRAFSADMENLVVSTINDMPYTGVFLHDTLNLAAGGNPLPQSAADGSGNIPGLLIRVHDGHVLSGGSETFGTIQNFMQRVREHRYAMNSSDPKMDLALAQTGQIQLTPLSGTDVTGESPSSTSVPRISNQTQLG